MKTPTWFARDDDRPPLAFAGIWRPWTDVRGIKAENPNRHEAEHRLFSFLICDANGIVGPGHPKEMPVLLTTPEELRTWPEAPTEIALELQRPPPGRQDEDSRDRGAEGPCRIRIASRPAWCWDRPPGKPS